MLFYSDLKLVLVISGVCFDKGGLATYHMLKSR